jgi:hypothetical protein
MREQVGGNVPSTVVELRESLLEDLVEQAGIEAAAQARGLLDYIQAIIPPEQSSDTSIFKDQVVSRSIPFVQQAEDGMEKHLCLLGVSHLLLNLLRGPVEESEDDYITSRFEDLADHLSGIERVDQTNEQLDNRLFDIYRGLVELASALGLTSCDTMCIL